MKPRILMHPGKGRFTDEEIDHAIEYAKSIRKPTAWRSKPYLDFIRAHICAACANPEVHAHHVRAGTDGGAGLKPSDCYAIPLCEKHHRELHDRGEKSFYEKHGMDTEALFRGYFGLWVARTADTHQIKRMAEGAF